MSTCHLENCEQCKPDPGLHLVIFGETPEEADARRRRGRDPVDVASTALLDALMAGTDQEAIAHIEQFLVDCMDLLEQTDEERQVIRAYEALGGPQQRRNPRPENLAGPGSALNIVLMQMRQLRAATTATFEALVSPATLRAATCAALGCNEEHAPEQDWPHGMDEQAKVEVAVRVAIDVAMNEAGR